MTLEEKVEALQESVCQLKSKVEVQQSVFSEFAAQMIAALIRTQESIPSIVPSVSAYASYEKTFRRQYADEIRKEVMAEMKSAQQASEGLEDEVLIKQGYIYFVSSPESSRIKIGYTGNPEKRIESLLTSSPSPLETLKVIEGTVAEERDLHRRFSHLRQHREWFTDCPELREYIASL
jgi:hypothetical protein